MAAISYSAANLFDQCPRKYHRLKVVKDIKEPPSEELLFGNRVHKAAELYGKDGTPLPDTLAHMKRPIDALLAIPGEKIFEQNLPVNSDLQPCGNWDKDIWVRGKSDITILPEDNPTMIVCADYKTGSNAKYADTSQLRLMSLLLLCYYTTRKTVMSGLVYLSANAFVPCTVHRKDAEQLWKPWKKVSNSIDTALDTGVWNATPNFTCRKHCSVLDCEHNGRA